MIAVVLVCCLEKAGGDPEALSPAASEPKTMFDGFMHSSFIVAVVKLSISACVMNDGSDAIPISSDDAMMRLQSVRGIALQGLKNVLILVCGRKRTAVTLEVRSQM